MVPSLELVYARRVQMRKIDLRGKSLDSKLVNESIPRALNDIDNALDAVLPIVESVKMRGEAALLDFAQEFDGVDPRPIRVPEAELKAALESLSPQLLAALETAIERVQAVSMANLPANTSTSLDTGAVVDQRWIPVDSVGLYVPGGKAVYPSSVVMNVVPAQVAGVSRLAMATPPQKEFGGRPHPTVLATAALLGVTEVYALGGPAAIAALAHGVASLDLEPVVLITGPGNNFVTAAKRALRGVVGIDSEAGATEIMILADANANPAFVAADLISQAEHDEAAAAVLVTDSEQLIDAVAAELVAQVASAQHKSRIEEALAGQQSAFVLVDDIDAAVEVANAYATEHLELHLNDAEAALAAIRNAGAVFVGEFSPVSLGDYMAGSNHVLPTSKQAKFGSGLGVHTFLRAQQVVRYSEAGLAEIQAQIDLLAAAEGLPAHGAAVVIRSQK
jgi:histidinol dehydrogenase